jgi:predicted acyltransferase
MPTASSGTQGRLASLDIFRGATIAAMTLVNNPGDWGHVYPPLEHAAWNGWTFTDTVFPFFLWIVGVSMTLSTAKRMERGDDKRRLFAHALRRAALLFAIGIGIGFIWNWNFTTVRIPGVLQRIALCYLIATAILLWTNLRAQILWVIGLFTAYWMAMTLIPVPGFGPGRLDVPVGNFAQWIDNLLLSGHMWGQTKVWDPEGLISSLPAIGTCLLGTFAGRLLRSRFTPAEKTAWFCVSGALLMGLGHVLSIWMPINKSLWTPTYALFMGGLAALCFGVWYWLADVQGYARWFTPLRIFGMNAIAVFIASGEVAISCGRIHAASGLSVGEWFFRTVCAPVGDPYLASEIFAVTHVALMFVIAWAMYRKGWFLKL